MTTLNFGHKQNIDKTFNSMTMMKNMLSYAKNARLSQISFIFLSNDDIDALVSLGCQIEDYGSSELAQLFFQLLNVVIIHHLEFFLFV